MEPKRVQLASLNECITCKICNGYLVEATTISECLHAFCKSCLVLHLTTKNTCPDVTCAKLIHYSHPLKYIRSDPTLQELVDKLVPGLIESEKRREQDFYKSRNLPHPKDVPQDRPQDVVAVPKPEQVANEEQVGLELVSQDLSQLAQIRFRFIRCSAYATISCLKKLIALKLFNSIDEQTKVDIFYNQELLGKDHTLKFITRSRFKDKKGPLQLFYRPAISSERS